MKKFLVIGCLCAVSSVLLAMHEPAWLSDRFGREFTTIAKLEDGDSALDHKTIEGTILHSYECALDKLCMICDAKKYIEENGLEHRSHCLDFTTLTWHRNYALELSGGSRNFSNANRCMVYLGYAGLSTIGAYIDTCEMGRCSLSAMLHDTWGGASIIASSILLAMAGWEYAVAWHKSASYKPEWIAATEKYYRYALGRIEKCAQERGIDCKKKTDEWYSGIHHF